MPEITIHESRSEAGELVKTRLSCEEGKLAISVDAGMLPLPDGALDAAMKRYGKPLAADADSMMIDERLDLGDGRSLVRFRFMSRHDVIARDYLVLYDPAGEALCELATSITAVLDHLARKFASTPPLTT